MKIYLNYEECSKEFYFDKMISFHGNIDNQNKLYDIILTGLSGSDKYFLLDNTIVKKKELNIIEFSSNSILDDLKMTSKSYNLKILDEIISEVDDEILGKINDELTQYQMKVKSSYASLMEGQNTIIEPSIQLESMKDLIVNNFKLVSKDKLNISNEVELQLNVILHYAQLHPERAFYLLIKHFDHCLDIEQMKSLHSRITHLPNVTAFIFTKSYEYYEYLVCVQEEAYMIENENITKLRSEIYNSECFDFLTKEELVEFSSIMNFKKRYIAYTNVVSEYNRKEIEKN